MSLAKRMLEVDRSIWTIGDRHRQNPWVGHKVRATWKRTWGKRSPGFTVEGILRATFCKNGRTLIGLVETDTGKLISCPWSKNWLIVEVIA